MEGVFMLIFLSITMLIGSFISGIIPLTLTLSESKMRHITIVGAGLLIGTALAVIIPEGIHTLYSNGQDVHFHQSGHDHAAVAAAASNRVRRSAVDTSFLPQDHQAYELFLSQISAGNHLNKVIKRFVIGSDEDRKKVDLFLSQIGAKMKQSRLFRSLNSDHYLMDMFHVSQSDQEIPRLVKRLALTKEDYESIELFLSRLSAGMNVNKVLTKRDTNENLNKFSMDLFETQLEEDDSTSTHLLKRYINLNQQDFNKINVFLSQLGSANSNSIRVLRNQQRLNDDKLSDSKLIDLFLNQISAGNRNNNRLVKRRLVLTSEDLEKLDLFMNQLSAGKIQDVNTRVIRNNFLSESSDEYKLELFLNQLSAGKINKPIRLIKRMILSNEDKEKLELFLNQISAGMNVNRVLRNSPQQSDEYIIQLFNNQVSAGLIKQYVLSRSADFEKLNSFLNRLSRKSLVPRAAIEEHGEENHERVRRSNLNDLVNQKLADKDSLKKDLPSDLLKPKDTLITENDEHGEGSHHGHGSSSAAHSSIGVTLVLGFLFMLVIDQIGGKFSHRHVQTLDSQAIRNKITFTTTLGLVVHAAADGIALGAAAATSKTDVEMIVFIAIMLHKAPAAFGLVSFLIHEGLERARVRKHLTIFAMSAPVMAIVTFIILKSQNYLNFVTSDSTGLCMLFSAGTFLYVSTVHVLPEVQAHNEDRQFRFSEMLSFIAGAIIPLFLSIGHSH